MIELAVTFTDDSTKMGEVVVIGGRLLEIEVRIVTISVDFQEEKIAEVTVTAVTYTYLGSEGEEDESKFHLLEQFYR
jgi:hypothetical protein